VGDAGQLPPGNAVGYGWNWKNDFIGDVGKGNYRERAIGARFSFLDFVHACHLAIAWTQLYLGVHFPSDIVTGWMVSSAWAIGVSLIVRPHFKQMSQIEETSLSTNEALHL